MKVPSCLRQPLDAIDCVVDSPSCICFPFFCLHYGCLFRLISNFLSTRVQVRFALPFFSQLREPLYILQIRKKKVFECVHQSFRGCISSFSFLFSFRNVVFVLQTSALAESATTTATGVNVREDMNTFQSSQFTDCDAIGIPGQALSSVER